jgi:WD40 repeat protein
LRNRKHLAEDISPYTCILPDCPIPFATYTTVLDWEKHSKSEHRPCRICPLCENAHTAFSGMEDLATHIETEHAGVGSPDFVLTAISWSGVATIGVSHCPLCDSTGPEYAPEFIQHVLGCIHDFSLCSLPWAGYDQGDVTQHDWICNLEMIGDAEQPIRQWFENWEDQEDTDASSLKLNLRKYDRVQVQGSDPTNDYFAKSENEYFDLASAQDSLEVLKRSLKSWNQQEEDADALGDWGFTDAASTVSDAKDESEQDDEEGTHRLTLEGHSRSVNAVTFSPDGKTLASASDNGTVRLWDVATGALQQTLKGYSRSINAIIFSPNTKILVSASDDGTVRLWDIATSTLQQTLEGHSSFVNAVTFSPDGKILASASGDGTVRLWNMATGTLQQILKGYSRSVNTVTFSPDGKRLASASDNGTIRLWNMATGVLQQTLKKYSRSVNAITFLPDGKTLASASDDGTVRLWNVATYTLQQTLKGYSHSVNAVTFSPDGKILASASGDGTVRLWDVATSALQQTLEGHSSFVNAVTFSPDGKILASASDDGTVRLWDVATCALQQTLQQHSVPVGTGGRPNPLDTTGLCLLSLDGGGVRGLSTLYILKSIMDRLNNEQKKSDLPPVKPCELFDLIGGTSTGG